MQALTGEGAVARYWQSVDLAAASGDPIKSARAKELLRLRESANKWRAEWFPELPELTIEAEQMSGRQNATVDAIGGWGQGLSIKIKASRIDPGGCTDRSLIFGLPLIANEHGENLRSLEARLMVLQQLLRAEQFRLVEENPEHQAAPEVRPR